MAGSLSDPKQPTIVRVVFEFYPMHGGSITHLVELTKKLNEFVPNQIIIAPNFGSKCIEIDADLDIPITRAKYPKHIEKIGESGIPVLPAILWGYTNNVIEQIEKKYNNNIIIYVHGLLLGSILLFKMRSRGSVIPLVVVQDSANPFNISRSSALATKLAYIFFRFFKPNFFLVVDDGMGLLDYQQFLLKNKIHHEVVSIGIDDDFFSPGLQSQINDAFIVLSTQRLDPFKRVDLGIMAFKKFLEIVNYPANVKLILVGDGSERETLEQIVDREGLGNFVELHGVKGRNEILSYLRGANVVIGTSLKSNLNLSIMEAMSCEKPVVVFSNEVGVSNFITNMKNGIIVKNGDINDFADKLELIYKNPSTAEMIGKHARETIVQNKSWNARISTELKIINVIMDSHQIL